MAYFKGGVAELGQHRGTLVFAPYFVIDIALTGAPGARIGYNRGMEARESNLSVADIMAIWKVIDRNPPGDEYDTAELLAAMRETLPTQTRLQLAAFFAKPR